MLVVFWHWLSLAAFLFCMEVLLGTGFLLWIGVAAGLVGILLFVFPTLNFMMQLILFIIAALSSWLLFIKRQPQKKNAYPTLNRRAEQQIGKTFTLDKPIEEGNGKVRIDDTMWLIRGPNLPAGSRIKIIAHEGVVLIVQSLKE